MPRARAAQIAVTVLLSSVASACGSGASAHRTLPRSSTATTLSRPGVTATHGAQHRRVFALGRSVRGRTIVMSVRGDPTASRRVLIIGPEAGRCAF